MGRMRRSVFWAGLITAALVVGVGGSPVLAATAAPAVVASSPVGAWGTAIDVPGTLAADGAQVADVSCAPGGQCMAAGNGLGKDESAFAVTDNNGSWGNPAQIPGASSLGVVDGEAIGGQVTSVSCPVTGDCLVVGTTGDSGWYSQEARGHWGKAAVVPGLHLSSSDLVLSLLASCASPGDCAVTGEYLSADATSATGSVFVASETGYNHWVPAATVAGVPTVADSIPEVSAVSCASAGNCVLGGGVISFGTSGAGSPRERALRDVRSARSLLAHDSARPAAASDTPSLSAVPFVASEVGGSWQAAVQPTGLPSADLALVSSAACPPGGECVVAGIYATSDSASAAGGSFLVTQSGTTWTATVTNSALGILALACPSAGECTAAGSTRHGVAAVARQDNGAWGSTTALRNAARLSYKGKKASSSEVDYLACSTAANCTAVGSYTLGNVSDPTGSEAFVVGEANGTWSSVAGSASLNSLNSGGQDAFAGVACASAANCAAGGLYSTSKQGQGAFVLAELPVRVTATTLARSHSVVTFGHEQSEKLSVSVTSKSGTPGGKVVVKAATKTVCTITLRSGKGSCTLSAKEFNAGGYHLVANYEGTWPYASSASSSGPLTVRR